MKSSTYDKPLDWHFYVIWRYLSNVKSFGELGQRVWYQVDDKPQ
jgi:hypothetical protein